MGKWSLSSKSIEQEIRDNGRPPRNGLPVDSAPAEAAIVQADRPVFCACPECGGTGERVENHPGMSAMFRCHRCRGNGSVREAELTPAEAEAARRSREEDDRWRNKVDYGRD